MYHAIEGGSTINIQGLECNLPPVGYVFNRFTNELEYRGVYQRSEKKEDQYWEIPPKPRDVKKRLRLEHARHQKTKEYFDPELQEYRDREWDRRINGFWFKNNGKDTYITGQHYFMLCHWTIEGMFPDFRDTDREWHYFWEYCWEDPNSFGMLEVTQRRQGKSVRAGCAIFERTSRVKERKSGIQSKTDLDGERLFAKQVVNPWKRLEQLFIPNFDKRKGTSPKNILLFQKTSTSGKNITEEYLEEKDLNSEIDYRSSTEGAYDGDKLYVYISDEAGKSENANIYRRHEIVKPCMVVGTRIIGKMLYTTTVEDIGDADKYHEGNFKRLWDESDHNNKDKSTNRTVSGLYRYFLPADRALEFDKYGFPYIENNREYLQSQRAAMAGNPTARAQFIKRYPLTVEEAFWTPGDECIYDVEKIEVRKSDLGFLDNEDLFYTGHLEWDGPRGSKVKFIRSKNGNFKVNKLFDIQAECELVNTSRNVFGNPTPKLKHLRCIGVDPFDHKKTVSGTGSNAGAYLYHKFDPMSQLSEKFLVQYLDRPRDFEDFHEDMVKLAFMSGAEIIIENNKQLLIRHFEDTGFKDFLYHFNSTPGIHANDKTKELLAKATDIYINEHVDDVVFLELLNDWSVFNLKNSTKFDAAMAAGWTLVGAYHERITSKLVSKPEQPKVYNFTDFY